MSAGESAYPEKTTYPMRQLQVIACQHENRHIQKKRRILLDTRALQHVSRIIATARQHWVISTYFIILYAIKACQQDNHCDGKIRRVMSSSPNRTSRSHAPRGNDRFDAPRRLGPRRGGETATTRSVQDRYSPAGAWEQDLASLSCLPCSSTTGGSVQSGIPIIHHRQRARSADGQSGSYFAE
jgi:hypothetical protein